MLHKFPDMGIMISGLQISGLPLLLPFKTQWELQYHTHILLSYPDQVSLLEVQLWTNVV